MLTVREWYDHLQFTQSNVTKDSIDCSISQTDKIIQDFLTRMEEFTASHEAKEVFVEVMSLMKGLASEIKLNDSRKKRCSPVLVGSVNESTQCFYPNEYDFFHALRK